MASEPRFDDLQLPADAELDEWAEGLLIAMWKRHHLLFAQPSDEKTPRKTWTDFKQGAQAMLALVRESPGDFGVVAEPTEEAGNGAHETT